MFVEEAADLAGEAAGELFLGHYLEISIEAVDQGQAGSDAEGFGLGVGKPFDLAHQTTDGRIGRDCTQVNGDTRYDATAPTTVGIF